MVVKERLVEVPKGWKRLEGATTAPKGYSWYYNGKSRFDKGYKCALIKEQGGGKDV